MFTYTHKLVQYYVKAAKANYIKLILGCMFTSCLSDFDFNVNTTLAGALKEIPSPRGLFVKCYSIGPGC